MINQSDKFIHEENLEWQNAGSGIMRKIMGYNGDLMMVKIRFQMGAVGELHRHLHSQSSLVMKGKFEVNIDNEIKLLEEGDGFFIPPNVLHGVKCLEEGILIDAFSPVREDFLSLH